MNIVDTSDQYDTCGFKLAPPAGNLGTWDTRGDRVNIHPLIVFGEV